MKDKKDELNLKISCRTCRRTKRVTIDHVVCKNRDPFDPVWSRDKPCNDWLPSIGDIKIRIARSKEGVDNVF